MAISLAGPIDAGLDWAACARGFDAGTGRRAGHKTQAPSRSPQLSTAT